MQPPVFLLILLVSQCADAEYKAVGSSFTFPPVNITDGSLYDLRTEDRNLVLTYHHGTWSVRPPYNERADFFSRNGTFVLRNLTKDDSTTYVQEVNMTVVARIHLVMIEPVKEPTLRKVNGSQCRVLLECCVQESDPLNVTFFKDGEEITGNITRGDLSYYLCINASDLGCSGTYSCKSSNPLGAKTSSEIKLLTNDHNNCDETTANFPSWSIVLFIIFFILIFIIILVVFSILCSKCQKNCVKTPDEESGDGESQDTSQLEKPLLDESSPKEKRRQGSSPNSHVTNSEEPVENLNLHNDLGLPTEIDTPKNPGQLIVGKNDPGHCGEETSVMELDVLGTASDHGPVANG
ncbi:uncharacterized protein [Eleutherodactylus coqui]|uniref:uncharacterized protein isoform X2 n=1 Tax=Eleutherodactylus coqui TaxID=57060 RepID=UPI0034624562